MKQFKLFIWILVITLLSTVFNIGGVKVNLLFAFTIAYSITERELPYRMGVTLIAAVISAAMGGGSFITVILMFVYSSVIAKALNHKRNSIPEPLQTAIYTFCLTGICGSLIYILTRLTIDISVLIKLILPISAVNAVFAVIIYLILKASMTKRRKTLLIS